MKHIKKYLLNHELNVVNHYIDERIKQGKKFSELEKVRKELVKELSK